MLNNEDIATLDLTFVPAWARKPASTNPYADRSDGARGDRGNRDADRGPRRNNDRHGVGGRPEGAFRPRRDFDHNRAPARGDDARGQSAPRQPIKPLPRIMVSFIPERKGLKPLVIQLGRTGRAFPLLDIASMFLSKPEYFAIKLETLPDEGQTVAPMLFQCSDCQTVFIDKERALGHAFKAHLDRFYEKQETQIELPKGNFVCVAKCGLSGELLGPPNYHGYAERLSELHRTRFAHLTLDEYRNRITNESDPALIERWKQEATKQTVWKAVGVEEKMFNRLADVESDFQERHASGLVKQGVRFIISGSVSLMLEDNVVASVIRDAWKRESHFPLRMSIAIRPAFRHLGMHIFKVTDKAAFVSAISPDAIDPVEASDDIRQVLEHLEQHPGHTRQEVVAALKPELQVASPEVAMLIKSLVWLKEKGHVIEFFDGTLAVPRRPRRPDAPRQESTEPAAPAEKSAPDPEPAASAVET